MHLAGRILMTLRNVRDTPIQDASGYLLWRSLDGRRATISVGEPFSELRALLGAFLARGQPLPAIVSRILAAPRTALRLAYRI